MVVYFAILAIIVLDFLIESVLHRFIMLNKSVCSRILNFVFKYRVITILGFVFVSTFRSLNVGRDIAVYHDHFMVLKATKCFGYGFELGYSLLCYLLSIILNCNIRFLFFVVSLFTSISFVMFINKFSCNKRMSLLLFVALGIFAQSLSALRQIIAIDFILFAIVFIKDKSLWRGILFILLASLFHVSALLCLIYIPLRDIKLTQTHIIWIVACIIVLAPALPFLICFIELIIPSLNFYSRYFVSFFQSYYYHRSIFNTLYTIGMVLIYTIFYLAQHKWFRGDLEKDSNFDFFLNLFFVIPIIRIVGFILGIESLLNRINMYFFFTLIILIPRFLQCFKKFYFSKWLYFIVYVGALVYMILNYMIHDSCGVVPYIFWF